MNRDMRNYMDGRGGNNRGMRNYDDERNPYGSRGGYVSSDRRYNDYDDYGDYYDDYGRGDYARGGRGGNRGSRGGRGNDYNMHFNGTIDSRYYDRGYDDFGGGMLSKKELREWQNKLCEEMDQQECEMFQYAPIIHQAEQMNISFEKYSKEEFYTAVLMMYTDYYKTCGNNVPMYISLAKDFLEDGDARVKYGEKLACYHDCIAG